MQLTTITTMDEELMDTLMMLVPELEKEAWEDRVPISQKSMSEALFAFIQEHEVSISDESISTYYHKLKEGHPEYLVALINVMLDKPTYGYVEAQ